MVKVALVVSIIALAVCLLTALHVLIFIRGGKIIKIVKNDYNEKELEALYEDIMTSGQREDA